MVELHEISKGSSSSSSTHGRGYDVFLSFRGVDTHNSFTSHLYNSLMHANITTFLDDEEIEAGEDLKPELESAIKSSKASVIVLSRSYVASTWCLDELVMIPKQHMKSNHVVIPIFYHVEPTHVRKQQSSFGDAMDKHRQKMVAETDENKKCQWAQKMVRWSNALREVVDLKGKDANGRQKFIYDDSNDVINLVKEQLSFLDGLLWFLPNKMSGKRRR
ncbi:disease resistance protein Roq1 [Lactuca sativa]|uniref:disease resistance protein Roq1 n=1 Tax=Lactuca sativa TaxID=4236 RepID=UPI000CD9C127|nr:disease resistance protein Roq1 [Lactuca sativa]